MLVLSENEKSTMHVDGWMVFPHFAFCFMHMHIFKFRSLSCKFRVAYDLNAFKCKKETSMELRSKVKSSLARLKLY